VSERSSSGPPPSELGPVGPVTELQVLAAVARADLHSTGRMRATVSNIANHLGWRYSGAATRRLRPPLARLVSEGLLETVEPPRHKRRAQQWSITAAGRRRLASAGPVELPESPQHRRWRQDRDVAGWALDGVRARAAAVLDEARDLLTESCRRPPSESDVWRLTRRFEARFKALALAIQMCERWPEPTDAAADEAAPDHVSALLPDTAKKRRD
jgi:DNA-binding MarR family transcriptional regulator